MSFNIRGSTLDTVTNTWDQRRSLTADVIKKYKPLIFGTQEGIFDAIQILFQRKPSST
jgi:hypothetical protein